MQAHTYFAAFDAITTKLSDLAALMQVWTAAAAQLTQGQPLGTGAAAEDQPPPDSGEVLGLPPSRLTLTFGFGPSLFSKDDVDRFGLAKLRPAALVDLPRFVGDQLVPERTGGDLSVQAPTMPPPGPFRPLPDPQATMHAVPPAHAPGRRGGERALGAGRASLPGYDPAVTPRNLMGFKDGTANVPVAQPDAPRPSGVGRRRGRRLDARRLLRRGTPDPHRARTLGPHEARLPGADHRPLEGVRRADRGHRRVRHRRF